MWRFLLIAILFISSAPAFAQSTTEAPIVKAVKHCVKVVHNTHPQEQYDEPYYKHFDAFYNPATQVVQNNAYRAGDSNPLFDFNKCMTEQGFPLSNVNKQ